MLRSESNDLDFRFYEENLRQRFLIASKAMIEQNAHEGEKEKAILFELRNAIPEIVAISGNSYERDVQEGSGSLDIEMLSERYSTPSQQFYMDGDYYN